MKNKISLLVFLFIFLIFNITANDQKSELNNAIQAYKAGNYEKALVIFEELNDKYESSGLFYNIGNCHLKMGNIGFSISAYYSALLRDPTNAEIRHNLVYAQNMTKDKILEENEIKGIKDIFLNIIRHFSLKFHQIVFLIIYFIFLILIVISYQKNRHLFSFKWIQASLAILMIVQSIFLISRKKDYRKKLGIVIAKECSVRYGPSAGDTEAFVIHEGSKFEIYNIEQQWGQIQLNDGKTGWVNLDNITLVK